MPRNGQHADGLDPASRAYAARQGALCARRRWSLGQAVFYPAVVLILLAVANRWPVATWIYGSYVLAVLFTPVLLLRVTSVLLAIRRDPALAPDPRAVPDAELPSYTVLVPLYREPEVAPDLLAALTALDYPTERLQILLLLEVDDAATRAALERCGLPPGAEILIAPRGAPRTKPRACNLGLSRATGDLLVIYDAEDRPEPDQLRKAAAAYRRLPADVVCLQCRLAHYNSRQGLLAAWSAMQYLVWFRGVLPGLQLLGGVLPLGGTSNHFRVPALRELDGWDPFNVTEDADLGLRIARAGKRTRMLDSTTWEEAVTGLGAWIRQRSRWVKGYLQTWLVHSRGTGPWRFGPWRFGLIAVHFGLGVLLQALAPLLWGVMLLWLGVGWSVVDIASPVSVLALVLSGILLVANLVVVGLNLAACLRWRRPDLLPAALLAPLSWVLLSLATWKALAEFVARPFHWAKTSHGGAREDVAVGWGHRLASAVFALAAFALLAGGVISAVWWRVGGDVRRQLPEAATQLPLAIAGHGREGRELWDYFLSASPAWEKEPLTAYGAGVEAPPSALPPGGVGTPVYRAELHAPAPLVLASRGRCDLSRCRGLACDIHVPADAPPGLRVIFYIKDWEGRWFQHCSPQELLPGRWTRLEVDLRALDAWRGCGHDQPYRTWLLHHVDRAGLQVCGGRPWRGTLRVAGLRSLHFTADERTARARLRVLRPHARAARVPVLACWELDFLLSKDYRNPFDPETVDAVCAITDPGGTTRRIRAFWYQDFTRELVDGRELLRPFGAGSWRVRYAPLAPGRHRWRLTVRDGDGAESEAVDGSFTATPRATPGYVRVAAANPRYLRFASGAFFYPIGHNICQPVDLQQPYPYAFEVPPDRGSYTYDRFLRRMAAAGENWGRIWLTPWNLGLEGHPDWPGYHGVGYYNLANAWRLDQLLAEAHRRGVYLSLTVMHKSEFQGNSWKTAAYNAANGGMCRRRSDFFRSPAVRRAMRERLRYLVARWGHHPRVMAWELFGEANLMPRYDAAASVAWHRDMAAYLYEIDHRRHPVFTHCHNWQRGHGLWALEEIACVQGNGYIRPPNRTPDHVVNFAGYMSEVERYPKPVFVAEYGGRSELGAPHRDYLEAQLHSGLWASFMQRFGGVAASWWWNFIDGADLYFHYRALADFARGMDRLAHDYAVVRPPVAGGSLRCVGLQAGDRGRYWVYHPEIFVRYADLPVLADRRLRLDGLAPGAYELVLWDCHAGVRIATRRLRIDGPATVDLPPVHRDLALRVEPVATAE